MANRMCSDTRLMLVGEADSASAVIAACEKLSPELILVGVSVLDDVWLAVIRTLRSVRPHAKIVVIGNQEKHSDFETSLGAGADAYLTKSMSLAETLGCLQAVMEGRRYATTEQVFRLAMRDRASQLTRREMDILACLAKGMSNRRIAGTAGICISTVKFHVKAIMCKLNARTRTEVAVVAAKHGLIHLQ